MDLGTPQGGALSPTLFNVLMDKIARHNFTSGTQIIIYADDMVLQCANESIMEEALAELKGLCLDMGLVINENKSKVQTRMRNDKTFEINGISLEKVLGIHVGFQMRSNEIDYLKQVVCTSRLKPLQVLAN
ncbi:uncharacterized protein LOC143030297 [Oratosquilla oratoria]|uniref:uncharacterized protein LOC143030297 n=1 Tax=Oratosquilla oratoria TaxID=337810 RepID=UPI003F768F15